MVHCMHSFKKRRQSRRNCRISINVRMYMYSANHYFCRLKCQCITVGIDSLPRGLQSTPYQCSTPAIPAVRTYVRRPTRASIWLLGCVSTPQTAGSRPTSLGSAVAVIDSTSSPRSRRGRRHRPLGSSPTALSRVQWFRRLMANSCARHAQIRPPAFTRQSVRRLLPHSD